MLAQRATAPNPFRPLRTCSRAILPHPREPRFFRRFAHTPNGPDRHTDHRPLGRSDRAGQPRARRSRGGHPPRTDPGGRANTRGAGAFRGRRADRASRARAATRIHQRAHAGGHVAAPGRGRKLFFRLLAQSPGASAGTALDGRGIRPRRRGTGDCRHAHERHDVLRRHAPVSGSDCAGSLGRENPRLHRPAGGGRAEPVGRFRQRVPREGHRPAR
jgi:hypothetical protein